MRFSEELAAMQPGLAWLLANVPDALADGAIRHNTQEVLTQLILKHSRLQGRAIQENVQCGNDGLTLMFFGDATTVEDMEKRFRAFVAETAVERGEEELAEEMVDAGTHELEGDGEQISEVHPEDLPGPEHWNDSPAEGPVGVEERVIEIISEWAACDVEPGFRNFDATPESMSGLLHGLEGEFEILISASDAEDFHTVQDIIDYVQYAVDARDALGALQGKVCVIISDELNVWDVTPSDDLDSDLFADKIGMTDLRSRIENDFLIAVPRPDMDAWVTVQDVIDYVQKATLPKQEPVADDTTYDRVVDILRDQLSLLPCGLSRDTDLVKDLNADSLDTVELLMDFEKEFEVDIADEDMEKLATVGQIVDYINAKL